MCSFCYSFWFVFDFSKFLLTTNITSEYFFFSISPSLAKGFRICIFLLLLWQSTKLKKGKRRRKKKLGAQCNGIDTAAIDIWARDRANVHTAKLPGKRVTMDLWPFLESLPTKWKKKQRGETRKIVLYETLYVIDHKRYMWNEFFGIKWMERGRGGQNHLIIKNIWA